MPATAQIRISADTAQFNKAMADVQKQMGKLSAIADKTSSTISMLFNKLKLVSGASAVGLGAGLVTSERQYRKFEKNMMEVFTLLPKANSEMFEKLKDDALKFSSEFGRLPEEVASGMYQTISAGVSPNNANEFLEVAQKSAIAGVTDLRTAVDALTNVVNAYGTSTYDVGYVADQMFTAVSMSKTTFRELADYMYQIIPTAAAMKIRIDDLMGSISALAATGTLTRVGTTQLRQFLIELSRTGDKANAAFMQGTGGMPIQEFIKNGGRLTEVIKILGDTAKRRRTDLRNLFSSVEAGNAALTLYNSENFQGMMDTLENDSTGSMDLAFQKMANTMQFRFDRILRTTMNGFIRLGDVMKPMFDDILTYFEGIAEKIENYDWGQLSRKFNVVWYKITEAIKQGKEWDIFSKLAEIAFKNIEIAWNSSVQPFIDKLTDFFAYLVGGGSGIGEGLMDAISGLGNLLVSYAKKFGVALLDALTSPMSFVIASLEQGADALVNKLSEILPRELKELLKIESSRDRAIKEGREDLISLIRSGDEGATDLANEGFITKEMRSLLNEIKIVGDRIDSKPLQESKGDRIYMSKLLDDLRNASTYEFRDERFAGGMVSEFLQNNLGRSVKEMFPILADPQFFTPRKVNQERGIRRDMQGADDLYQRLQVIYPELPEEFKRVRPSQLVQDDDFRQRYNEAREKANVPMLRAPDASNLLFEGIDVEKFLDGIISKDYLTVIDRLRAVARANRSTNSNMGMVLELEEYADFLKKRLDGILNNLEDQGLMPMLSTPAKERFLEDYEKYKQKIQKYVDEFQKNEKPLNDQEIEDNLKITKNALNDVRIAISDLYNSNIPFGARASVDEFGNAIYEFNQKGSFNADDKIKELKKLEGELQGMLDNLGKPKPRVEKDGAESEDIFTRGQGGDELSVGKAYAQPVVDSMQKIGGGGNAFTGLSQAGLEVEKMLQERKNQELAKARNQKLIDAMSELTQAIKGVNLTENKKGAIKSEAQAIAIDTNLDTNPIQKILESAFASKETKEAFGKKPQDMSEKEGVYALEFIRQIKNQGGVTSESREELYDFQEKVISQLKTMLSDKTPEPKVDSRKQVRNASLEGRELAEGYRDMNPEVGFVIKNLTEFRDALSFNFRDLTKGQREGLDMRFDKDSSRRERVIEFNRLQGFINAINNIEGAPEIDRDVLTQAKTLMAQPQYDSNVASKISEAATHLESASIKLENRIESFIEGDFSQ